MPLDEPILLEEYYERQRFRETKQEKYLQVVRDQYTDLLREEIKILTGFLLTLCEERGFKEDYDMTEIQRWYKNKKAYLESNAQAKASLERDNRAKKLQQYNRLKTELGL